MNSLSCQCRRTLSLINQHLLKQQLDAIRQKAITWAKVQSVPRSMSSLGHKLLNLLWLILFLKPPHVHTDMLWYLRANNSSIFSLEYCRACYYHNTHNRYIYIFRYIHILICNPKRYSNSNISDKQPVLVEIIVTNSMVSKTMMIIT